MNNLQVILGGEKLSVDTAEQINGQMGRQAGVYLDNLPKPDADSEAKFLVATADCKGVPLVKEDAAKVAAFGSQGEWVLLMVHYLPILRLARQATR